MRFVLLFAVLWVHLCLFPVFSLADDVSSLKWNKPYVGIAFGGAYGQANPTVAARGTYWIFPDDPLQTDPEGSKNLKELTPAATAFAGINYQWGNLVLGVEADYTLAPFNKKYDSAKILWNSVLGSGRYFELSSRVTSSWMASIRPRLGYACDKSLLYISAGPAWSQFRYQFDFEETAGPDGLSVVKKKLKRGWTAGIGYERMFESGFGLRVEYKHYQFSDIMHMESMLRSNGPSGFNHRVDFKSNVVQLGIFKTF